MVDFKKLLGKQKLVKDIDPTVIFGNLDKESGKEYLRPPQGSVLKEWHENLRAQKDTIVKLHTGQGKTLIGLIILQSSINEGMGPAVYICPNNYLVDQTVEQARSFGIKIVQFPAKSTKPPQAFLNSDAILVTNCNKLFNGKSVFGVLGSGREPIQLGAIVIDDAHKCLEVIREAFSIIVKKQNPDGKKNVLYEELWTLFEDSLRRQAPGTCLDIQHGNDCLMAVPFWKWYDKRREVLEILGKHKQSYELLFVWDLLKDRLDQCICIFSGSRLEIAPRLLPLELIPSFSQAQRRIFLSATLTEDAFLVRDLGIRRESVTNPLSCSDVKYCGERLILIPTLVDTTLARAKIINWLSSLAAKHGEFGVVSITPSFRHTNRWESEGARVTNVQNLYENINDLNAEIKRKIAKKVLVLVNEYDGVDLPDATCRILCLDSLPSYSLLIDRYSQETRPSSLRLRRQLAQRVEQGMGRAIRGSSDWCIVVTIGNDLTDFLSEKAKRAFLSKEAQMQIRIGEELAEEMKGEGGQLHVIEKLVNQCLKRDEGWKEFYKERMSKLETQEPSKEQLNRSESERLAEVLYQQGHYEKAVEVLQKLVEGSDQTDKGWFLQLMATYLYPIDPTASMDKQLKAHTENPQLFRPETGIAYSKIASTKFNRASRIMEWVRAFESHSALIIHLMEIMDKLTFHSFSETFEDGVDELGGALGFRTQRPEKALGSGPDNLWQLGVKKYWIIECKNMVSGEREGISKSETGQLGNDIGWFKVYYEDCEGVPIIIHPAETLKSDAYLAQPFWMISESLLEELKNNVIKFFNSLSGVSFNGLSQDLIAKKLKEFNLDIDDLMKHYLRRVEQRKVTK